MMLAQIAQQARPAGRRRRVPRAGDHPRAGRTGAARACATRRRAWPSIYRARGALDQARRHAAAAVEATETAGTRFTLPVRIGVLADIYAAQGHLADADRLYDQATDIVEGIMVNVPSREAQARLIGVMSDLYTGHFRLAADRLHAPVKAFQIIERARGRAVADVLRTLPDADPSASEAASDRAAERFPGCRFA